MPTYAEGGDTSRLTRGGAFYEDDMLFEKSLFTDKNINLSFAQL
jgi:hypothetical protein